MLRSQNRLELLTISRKAIVLPAVMQHNTPSCAMVSDNTTLILILIFLSQLILKCKSMLLIKLTGKVQEKKLSWSGPFWSPPDNDVMLKLKLKQSLVHDDNYAKKYNINYH